MRHRTPRQFRTVLSNLLCARALDGASESSSPQIDGSLAGDLGGLIEEEMCTTTKQKKNDDDDDFTGPVLNKRCSLLMCLTARNCAGFYELRWPDIAAFFRGGDPICTCHQLAIAVGNCCCSVGFFSGTAPSLCHKNA